MADAARAQDDLAIAQKLAREPGGYPSSVDADNLDLVDIALGWAAMSVRR
jgi:hypothetical protein